MRAKKSIIDWRMAESVLASVDAGCCGGPGA
jgi:hypothetical protein